MLGFSLEIIVICVDGCSNHRSLVARFMGRCCQQGCIKGPIGSFGQEEYASVPNAIFVFLIIATIRFGRAEKTQLLPVRLCE